MLFSMVSEGKKQNGRRPARHVHLVGIGGSGMSAIAWVLLGRGYTVSGSDMQTNSRTDELAANGAVIYSGHAAANIHQADVLVVSSAIPGTNPELAAARTAGVPILKRADFLGRLMAGQTGVTVAGSHGKTTTTGMIVQILQVAEKDPSVIVGGDMPALGRNGRAGRHPIFVIEADEYDYMFLGLKPDIAVVTNVEHDHPDMFPTLADYTAAFQEYVALLPAGGHLIVSADDAGALELVHIAPSGVTISTYGLNESSHPAANHHLVAVDTRPNPLGGTDFLVQRDDQIAGLVRLRVPGEHNVRNALAAIAACWPLDCSWSAMQEGLSSFGGITRRFQVIGEAGDVTVIDDYAHHPTEIQATLAAARQRYPGRRLWAVWQPHTYSRTQLLQDRFAESFQDADLVVALDIYRSRETNSLGISTAAVVAQMQHPYVRHIGRHEDAAAYILDRVRPGDIVLTLGAGDGNVVGQFVLDGLQDVFR
jgi:UDP-N-acetylmuramate--alanine ligase